MIPGTIPAEFEFRSKFRQNHLINLAGPSVKFDSSGILGIARILPDSGWNQWRTIKTSVKEGGGRVERREGLIANKGGEDTLDSKGGEQGRE